MRFPRNAKISRGQLDVAPFASVFFLMVMFTIMGTLVYTPGIPVQLELPKGADVPGTGKPSAAVSVDANGRLYFRNQVIEVTDLRSRLKDISSNSAEPMSLIIQADKRVPHETLVRLALLARTAGFSETRLAVLPQPVPSRTKKP